MISKARDGYGIVLQTFWAAAAEAGFRLRQKIPTAPSAFCAARSKLGWRPFAALVRETASRLEDACGKHERWKKRRVYAVDGSKLSLPRSRALLECFGRLKTAAAPMLHLLTVFNVFTRTTVAVTFGRYSSGERTLVHDVLDGLQTGSVLLFDRGFPGYPLFRRLIDLKLDFVARVPKKGTFKEVQNFVASNARSGRISIYPRRKGHPIELRIVRWRRSNDDMILLTSLSSNEASHREVTQLYGLRWSIETCFKSLKVDAFSENSFRSLTPDGIKQEICARLLFLNLASHLLAEAAHEAGRSPRDLVAKSARAALFQIPAIIAIVLGRRSSRGLSLALGLVAATRGERRKNRSFPRISYRASPRWDRKGKTSRRGH